MRHVSGIALAVFCGVCLFGVQRAFADQITLVPLRGQLVADSGQPNADHDSISNDGYSQDVHSMDADSDQLTVKIADRHADQQNSSAKTSDDDGATIKLIKLARRQ